MGEDKYYYLIKPIGFYKQQPKEEIKGASTSEALPDSPLISKKTFSPWRRRRWAFQKDLERAKANYLKNYREKVVGVYKYVVG